MPIDYDALAAQARQSTPAPAASASPIDYDALAAQARQGPAPTFRTVNATDELGNPLVDPNTIGTAVSHVTAQVNPLAAAITIGRALIPEQAARLIDSGLTARGAQAYGPINTLKALGAAQGALYDRARQAYQRGDYVTAARHFVNYLLPVVGPALDRSSDLFQAGKWAAGGADALGLGLAMFGPQAVSEVAALRATAAQQAGLPARAATAEGAMLTPAEASSNAFARAEGIPLDAATATAHPGIAAVQKVTAHSVGGSYPALAARAAQDAALTRVGRQLAAEVHPTPMTPETAGYAAQGRLQTAAEAFDAARAAEGEAVAAEVHPVAMTPETAGAATQGRIQGAMRTFGDLAAEQYDALRAIEADPRHAERVQTAPAGSPAFRSILAKLTQGVEGAVSDANPEIQAWAQRVGGRGPTGPELTVMRQIEAELDAQPYTPYLLRPTRYGGGLEHVEGTGGAGAPVYDQILQAAPGTAGMTRNAVQAAIQKTLETGEWTNASRGAFDIAQQRLRQGGTLTGPTLDPGAPLLGGTETVPLPVHLGLVKQQLAPLHQQLLRESQLVPLQGDKGRALVALDRLMNGPDVAPVSVVDPALGDLKAMARSDIPELRTAGQGVAAAAVKRLSAAVDVAVAKAGPAAQQALEAGRQATVAKHGARRIYEGLREEPVGTFRQLTQPGDAAVAFLRQVGDYAPESLPELGRATLEQWADLTPPQRLAAWARLGPETKARLFGTPEQVARLDALLTRATQNAPAQVAARLQAEPVGAFAQMTAPNDAGIRLLRQVATHAPDSLPELGRAKLEQWLTKATEADKFQHVDRIYAEWKALGPETKARLFGGSEQVARLDDFFTLAKRMGANPNASGTAPTLLAAAALQGGAFWAHPLAAIAGQVGMYGVSKLLYTPQGVRLINRALTLSARAPSGTGAAAARAAWAEVANAARATAATEAPALTGPRALPQAASREE